jgi:hypothetical protein
MWSTFLLCTKNREKKEARTIHSHINWQWDPVKYETLRENRLIKFSHCELSIYMQQHFNSSCVWNVFLSINMIFYSLCFLSRFHWYIYIYVCRVATRKLQEPKMGCLMVYLESSLWTFYGCHCYYVNRYGISLSNMT